MRSSEAYMAPQPSFNAAVPPPANPTQLDSTTLAAAQVESQRISSVVSPSILVLSAQLAMLFVTNARKGTFRERLQKKSKQIQREIYSFPLAPNTASTGIPESFTKSSQLLK